MREKKNIKLRTDMYEDTKFKIIDTMAERDTINYIWTRLLTLCGKVNDSEGRLYVTKNMPYTIEILSVEFNRSFEQIENAINVFIDLNMISKTFDGAYKINNWCKYQDIGRKNKKSKEQNNTSEINKSIENTNNEDDFNSTAKEELNKNENKEINKYNPLKQIESADKQISNKSEEYKVKIIDITNTSLAKDKVELEDNKKKVKLESKKKKTKVNKKKKTTTSDIIVTDDDDIDNEIIEFTDSVPLMKDCKSIAVYDFT